MRESCPNRAPGSSGSMWPTERHRARRNRMHGLWPKGATMNDMERGAGPAQVVASFWWRATAVPALMRSLALLLVLGGAGCSLGDLVGNDQLPPNVSDPAITETPEGARAAYTGTLAQ